ncbi:uncharacterized protein LTR77_000824 [Saxophila tyrrhenica]|uniref:Uncharacterized protein n=1 Tax=Saxophila tyrrhenica TaxID=1690608 RepID=A0AAV9PTM0_9PEZI|nr:hypothetical protein LTR77_000824 [Saxophila tyrrhenica]
MRSSTTKNANGKLKSVIVNASSPEKSVIDQPHQHNLHSKIMADVATSSGSAPDGETPNQRQARLRREKRQKKMEEQGEDRLARIKALNGGIAPPEEMLGGPAKPQAATVADDPEEVDISQHASGYGTPSKPQVDATENPLAAAMLQMQQQEARNRGQQGAQGNAEDDPMVKMMQQMVGLMGGNPQDPNAQPPDLPLPLKMMMGGGGQATKEQAPPATGSAYMWRIVHAIFAFVLASYIAFTSTFNGTKLGRNQSVYHEEAGFGASYGLGPRLFMIFCTSEVVLQGSRYFVEKGQLQGNGILAKVANSGFVPEPWAGYVRTVGRYVGILQTIMADAMVIVFVFGILVWWQGMPIA